MLEVSLQLWRLSSGVFAVMLFKLAASAMLTLGEEAGERRMWPGEGLQRLHLVTVLGRDLLDGLPHQPSPEAIRLYFRLNQAIE